MFNLILNGYLVGICTFLPVPPPTAICYAPSTDSTFVIRPDDLAAYELEGNTVSMIIINNESDNIGVTNVTQ